MRWVITAAALVFSAGCIKQVPVKEATVEQVATWVKQGSASVFDANNADFRKDNGVVPGAVLLGSYREYDVASTLPQDKSRQLVFYCTSRL